MSERTTPWLIALLALAALLAGDLRAGEFVIVPVRWCALEGTPAVEHPECSCEESHTKTLQRRMSRANAEIYLPECFVVLRSAAAQQVPTFPVIADPCDPAEPPLDNMLCSGSPKPEPEDPDYGEKCCPGVTGDIRPGVGVFAEQRRAMQDCAAAWDAEGVGTVGIVGVNVRRFVTNDGTPSTIGGKAAGATYGTNGYGSLTSGSFTVVDNDFTVFLQEDQSAECLNAPPCEPLFVGPSDSGDGLMAHEAGHALSLDHLDGTVMEEAYPFPYDFTEDANGPDAPPCPPDDDPLPEPTSQCGQLRLQAVCRVDGTTTVEPGVHGHNTDQITLPTGDGGPGHLDLAIAGLSDQPGRSKATLFWETAEVFPQAATGLRYVMAVDLDRNRRTGGRPAEVGIDLEIDGVELIGLVTVTVRSATGAGAGKSIAATPRLWRYSEGRFLERRALGAAVVVTREFTDPLELPPVPFPEDPFRALLTLDFDRALLGVGTPPRRADVLRVRARSQDPASGTGDRPPEATLYMTMPTLPVCQVDPPAAFPGDEIRVTARDLPAGKPVEIHFGTRNVGRGTADRAGRLASRIVIPRDAATGFHAVTVTQQDPRSAITADCVSEVLECPDRREACGRRM